MSTLYSAPVADATPHVSVLLPVFNAARYVHAAVSSVLAQTYRNFELIVLDDGSSDASFAILQSLAKSDSRIRLVSRANKGLVATLNEMLALARGELICRMDADDICRPSRIELQVNYLAGHPECVAVGSRSLFIDPEGLPIFEVIDKYTHEKIDRALMTPQIGILHPALMARRSTLIAIGGYRAEFPHAEDLDLLLRLAEIGRLANLSEVLLEYRVHLSSVSHSNITAQSTAARNAVREACLRRGLLWDPDRHAALAVPETLGELHRKWAWWALGAGNRATARKHAFRALRAEPRNRASWHLMACALRP
jgi:glycosyltransferase involved in cell wall biosynthesis